MKKTKPQESEAKKSAVLIYCPSNIILSGILKDLETTSEINIRHIEKNTIDSFMESIKKIKPDVIFIHQSKIKTKIEHAIG